MTKDNAKDYLPLVQALVDGKTLQLKFKNDTKWSECGDVSFSYPAELYRIKPEPPKPREFTLYPTNLGNYSTSIDSHCALIGKPIRVVEVLDDVEQQPEA